MTAPGSDAILARLLTLHPKLVDLSLGRMERLLEALNHPEERLPPVVHVTGTNGKGSTLAFLRAMLEAAGYSVHVYASPHLVRFHERIRLAGELIKEDHLQSVLDECEAANAGEEITFFEITTAAAFLAFSRVSADIVLLENGLGGRLDATNMVTRPAATGITSVSMDHQQFLGDTLEKIAFEKAGIIKAGVPCVVGPQLDAADGVVSARADELAAPLFAYGDGWRMDGLTYSDRAGRLDLPEPSLPGNHQHTNAGMAVALARTLADLRIDDAAIRQGIQSAAWPARLQKLTSGPLVERLPKGWEVWLDGGHNPDAGRIIADHARAHWSDKPLLLISGMINSKAAGDYFKPLSKVADRVNCVTIPGEQNAFTAEELAKIAGDVGLVAAAHGSAGAALEAHVSEIGSAARVLVCGSLYFAGHVLRDNG